MRYARGISVSFHMRAPIIHPPATAGGTDKSAMIPTATAGGTDKSAMIPTATAGGTDKSAMIPTATAGGTDKSAMIPTATAGGTDKSAMIPTATADGTDKSAMIPTRYRHTAHRSSLTGRVTTESVALPQHTAESLWLSGGSPSNKILRLRLRMIGGAASKNFYLYQVSRRLTAMRCAIGYLILTVLRSPTPAPHPPGSRFYIDFWRRPT